MRTMVLEYKNLQKTHKSPSFVGKYSSTMGHLALMVFVWQFFCRNPSAKKRHPSKI